MKVGDPVVLRLFGKPIVAIGEVAGDYQYRQGETPYPHVRAVKWLNKEVPRNPLDADLHLSLFANPWLFPWNAESAEDRVRAIANGENAARGELDRPRLVAEEGQNIREYAGDEIRNYVAQVFPRHQLADLVGAILQEQGYVIEISPPGPDGGIDIVAGGGPLGFDKPRMCVQ